MTGHGLRLSLDSACIHPTLCSTRLAASGGSCATSQIHLDLERYFEPNPGFEFEPPDQNGDEPPYPLLSPVSLEPSHCESGPLASPQTIPTLPTIYLQHGVPFHGLSGYRLQYAELRLQSRIALNVFRSTLGLIFVLSLVSIIFIWTEYPYLRSKSALVVITPILLATVLLVFSS